MTRRSIPRHALQRQPVRLMGLMGLMALSSLLLALMPLPSLAHPTGDSHLRLQTLPGGQLAVQWDLSLRDLDDELLLDTNEDGQLNAEEVRPRWADMLAWAQSQLAVRSAAGSCALVAPPARAAVDAPELWRHDDGVHARLRWRVQCPGLDGLTVQYQALSATPDSPHRAVVRLLGQGPMQQVLMGGPRTRHTFRTTSGI